MDKPKFTNAGKDLQLRASVGEADVVFTKIQLGDGVLGATDYKTLNALVSPKITLPLTGININNGSAAIKATFTNDSMLAGFQYREIGLYAKNPDNASAEILYCYANFGDEGGYIAEPSSKLIEKLVTINAIVGDAQNVSAVLDGSAVYIDVQELNNAINAHNNDLNAHPELHRFSVYFCIDPETEEDESLRDGTATHPFGSLSEAKAALPNSTQNLTVEMFNSETIEQATGSVTFTDLNSLKVIYTGDVLTPPVIYESISCDNCKAVIMDTLIFKNGFISVDNCLNFNISTIILSDGSQLFITDSRSTIKNVKFQNGIAQTSSDSYGVYLGNSTVNITGCSFVNNQYGISLGDSNFVILGGDNTFTTQQNIYNPALNNIIIDSVTGAKLTDGSVKNHLVNTNNPHNVTLQQLLISNIIPIANGGTGQNKIHFSISAINHAGVKTCYFIIPGTNILVVFGRFQVASGSEQQTFNWQTETAVNSKPGALFANSNYTLILPGGQSDIAYGDIAEQLANGVKFRSFPLSNRAANFIALGEAAASMLA